MAKKPETTGTENGTEVLEKDAEKPGKFNSQEWLTAGEKKEPEEEEEEAAETEEEEQSDDQQEEEEQQGDLGAQTKKTEAKDDQEEDEGSIDNPLAAFKKDSDNDFTLDEEGEKKEGDEKAGAEKKTDEPTDPVARIAKEFGIQDASDVDHLISSLKKELNSRQAQDHPDVVKIDEFLKKSDREVWHTYLVNEMDMTTEDADKHIAEILEGADNEDAALREKALPLRAGLRKYRGQIIAQNVAAIEARGQKEAGFAKDFVGAIADIKTMFDDIPLKSHVAKLREFKAKYSDPEKINAMRNDPKLLATAMFHVEHGKDIVNGFLKEGMGEAEKRGFKKSFDVNVGNRLLNKTGKSGNGTLKGSPNRGTKDGQFDPSKWLTGQ